MSPKVPEKPSLEGLEEKWGERWEAQGIYRFDRSKARDQIYSIDTPPPTVSGELHVGHCFSYAHTDLVARFQRMRGREVFYPMGWDDNGLPTERRVQKDIGIRCDPSLPYDPNFEPPAEPGDEPIPVSRVNFVEICSEKTLREEKAYEALWRRLGLSVDWSMTYTTIGRRAQLVSQRSFLRMLEGGWIYQAESPTPWDIDYHTAVAQAEMKDFEIPGSFYRIKFARSDGHHVEIDTTRPELIPACVALVAHPSDDRYKNLIGGEVTTPLFGARIPVVAHHLAEPDKGTGIAMICTFGDLTDVTWWRELRLPLRTVLQPDGKLGRVDWKAPELHSADPGTAQSFYDELTGMRVEKARERIGELLSQTGDLVGTPEPISHAVKFYENGESPLEIIMTRQWFAKTLEMREALLERGTQLNFYPSYMRRRYEAWVNGLNQDWCLSRQRFFGVPFPVWYPVDEGGRLDYDHPITAPIERLPVDPSTDVPAGFSAGQRGQPGGFAGDTNVMDTWATSSLTPQIISGAEEDDDLFRRVFPMDLRPQAHDIIRTWLFYTIVRSHLEYQTLPWHSVALSGYVIDPLRRKLSKSLGNILVTPHEEIDRFGADALRYWAASQRLGLDTVYDENIVKVGRRLAIKILNASKFVLSRLGPEGEVSTALDRSMLEQLASVIEETTKAFEKYEHTRALDRVETFFWSFCDNYLEMVKARAYGSLGEEGARSGNRALTLALSTFLRLFAPFLPYVTEEVWSWWREGPIHRAPWPPADEIRAASRGGDPIVLEVAGAVLGEIRKAKTAAKKSLKAEVARAVVTDTPERLSALKEAEADLRQAGNVSDLVLVEGEPFTVETRLTG